MTTKPENQQIQQGATAPSRGFKEQRQAVPALLFLIYRSSKGCKQYPFESIEQAVSWAMRKPYRDELLICHAFVDRRKAGTVICRGDELEVGLNEWFSDFQKVGGVQ